MFMNNPPRLGDEVSRLIHRAAAELGIPLDGGPAATTGQPRSALDKLLARPTPPGQRTAPARAPASSEPAAPADLAPAAAVEADADAEYRRYFPDAVIPPAGQGSAATPASSSPAPAGIVVSAAAVDAAEDAEYRRYFPDAVVPPARQLSAEDAEYVRYFPDARPEDVR